MAGNEDESDSQSVKSIESDATSVKNIVKCCEKIVKIVACVRCHGLYHVSCAKRQKSVKFINAGSITCGCSGDEPACDGETRLKLQNEKLETENQLLRQIIEEMKQSNEVLKQNNSLLLENIDLIVDKNRRQSDEKEKARMQERDNERANINTGPVTSYANAVNGNKPRNKDSVRTVRRNAAQNTSDELKKRGTSELPPQSQNLRRTLSSAGPSRRNDGAENNERNETFVNNNDHDPGNNGRNESEDELEERQGWKPAKGRKRTFRKTLGQNEDENAGFLGVKPKIWLYINRVRSGVTEETILKYLKEKTKRTDEEFIVKFLGNGGGQKSFVVAADSQFKDMFYSPSFWPTGVGYRRFDFRTHRQSGKGDLSAFLGAN